MTEIAETPAAAATDRYEPSAIEPKWRDRWAADKLYETRDDAPAEIGDLRGGGVDLLLRGLVDAAESGAATACHAHPVSPIRSD